MQKQQGFTLIELVVVIIILGILAVTAAPKFINLQGDARVSTLQGVKAAIQSANSLVYSKSALAGVEKGDTDGKATVDIGTGIALNVVFGYTAGEVADVINAVDMSTDDWGVTGTGGTVKIQQIGAPDLCFFEYTQATATSLPTFSSKNADGDVISFPVAADC
ncbi:type II secretion system GspH family protein [Shewanella electrodiphila]|uniref:Type II secretion system GspH family protein n=1 Tax=Shewanella electrodiphila TaxID=934143 RepID=A0ABT0KR81_9GAMM|nr:type II secretion system protein [Shewanella electrodiphila]MCL1046362.1 type II secretion system GspH family protein [Shewanella electrodiphila]